MIENQTPELFWEVNKAKYSGTLHLDWYVSVEGINMN